MRQKLCRPSHPQNPHVHTRRRTPLQMPTLWQRILTKRRNECKLQKIRMNPCSDIDTFQLWLEFFSVLMKFFQELQQKYNFFPYFLSQIDAYSKSYGWKTLQMWFLWLCCDWRVIASNAYAQRTWLVELFQWKKCEKVNKIPHFFSSTQESITKVVQGNASAQHDTQNEVIFYDIEFRRRIKRATDHFPSLDILFHQMDSQSSSIGHINSTQFRGQC